MNLQDYISQLAAKYNIPSQLPMAIAAVNSDMNNSTWNFDPTHQWLWNVQSNKPFRNLTDSDVFVTLAPNDFPTTDLAESNPDTEFMAQRCRWTAFQMTGSTLRQVGFTGRFQELQTNPRLSVHFALTYLKLLEKKYVDRHGWAGVAAAFNSGRPRMTENVYVNREFLIALTDYSPNLRHIIAFR